MTLGAPRRPPGKLKCSCNTPKCKTCYIRNYFRVRSDSTPKVLVRRRPVTDAELDRRAREMRS